ncbi:MAG: hypothetical protein HOH74_17490 [Gemmatimonadetes bacterium]|jgi:hypothetical protein|nr:hypothetical protein [Gemmatimonadota bacterium]
MNRGYAGTLLGGLYCVLQLLSGCGGSDSAGSENPPEERLPGSVAVDNRTAWGLEVAWLSESDEAGPQILRTVVPAGELQRLHDEPLPAGTELALDLVILVPPETGPRVRRKATVQVDGDRVVLVRVPGDDPFEVVVSVAPAD